MNGNINTHYYDSEGFNEYNADKRAFLLGHEFKEKSRLDGNHIYKVYTRDDYETFHEDLVAVYDNVQVPNGPMGPKNITAYVEDRVEWWTSKNGTSKYWHQRY